MCDGEIAIILLYVLYSCTLMVVHNSCVDMYVCIYIYVCVRERERELYSDCIFTCRPTLMDIYFLLVYLNLIVRVRNSVSVYVCVCVCMYVCMCVCV